MNKHNRSLELTVMVVLWSREVLLIGVLLMTICIVGCEKNTTVPKAAKPAVNEPDQTFLKSRIVITESGITNAIVQAESVKVYMDSGFTAVDGGVQIEFFNKKGEHVSTLNARQGQVWGLYDKVDSLKAIGSVTVVSTDKKKRLETPNSLIWIASTRMIFAERNTMVKLTTEDAVEQGINFVANEDLSEYRMENVSGFYEKDTITLPGK